MKILVSEYDDSDVSDDEDDYDDDEDIEYGHSRSLSLHRSFDDEDRYDAHKYLTVDYDDRPITPMRDKMVYNVKESSLDFKDGKLIDPRVCRATRRLGDETHTEIPHEWGGGGIFRGGESQTRNVLLRLKWRCFHQNVLILENS